MTTNKRTEAASPRQRFLYTDVTEKEYQKILRYCRQKRLSISQFFADLLLQEASKPQASAQDKVTVKVDLTQAEHEKLELLSRLHGKKSVADYIRDILQPELHLQRLHTPGKTKLVRYYLSDDEYQTITEYMNKCGVTPRNYSAILALRAIEKTAKTEKK